VAEVRVQVMNVEPGGARAPATSFVGRRDELAQLRTLLAGARLLTITGPGGSGKTRLAEELAANLSRAFDREVAVAYLAGAGAAAEVGEVVMAAVGLHGGGDPREALAEYLGGRRYLLVLDNCEHLRRATAELVVDLQATCAGLVVLATSRRALAVPGEQLFPIQGLTGGAALTLFTERVRLASPSFVLTEDQRALAVGLCARLEGMPLAIELAAARLRHLGLADLAERLARRLGDLGSEESLAPARQRTLRAAIDWSHDLLDESQRIVWRRLSVFADGFTLAAAESVAAFAPIGADGVAQILGELVDRSMVVFDIALDRYRLIEAMREYARERLDEAGEAARAAERHRAWMLERALDLERRWWGPDQARLLDGMAADAANLRAALESARAAGDGEVGLRIATSSHWYWMTRASHAEAERWFLPFLQHQADSTVAAKANVVAAWIAVLSGQLGAGRRFLDRAADLEPDSSDVAFPAYVKIVRALEVITEGELEQGAALARAVLTDANADPICRSWARIELEIVAFFSGDLRACLEVSGEATRICEEAGESWSRVTHLHALAIATWQLGDPAAGRPFLLDALRIDRRLDDIWHRAWSIEALGWVTADLGWDERAARLLGIAQACWAFTGSSITPPWQVFRDTAMAKLGRRLGEARLARELAAGRALDRARAMSYALEEGASDTVDQAATSPVSPRELEVAALVAEGLANREIGERLFLSHRTVETHVQHLMDKLGVSSRAEIAAWHARTDGAPRPPD
jgi:predicted ATPase/DNA-binding CsgD family transcriptional regulator